jgi:hypothetical protein
LGGKQSTGLCGPVFATYLAMSGLENFAQKSVIDTFSRKQQGSQSSDYKNLNAANQYSQYAQAAASVANSESNDEDALRQFSVLMDGYLKDSPWNINGTIYWGGTDFCCIQHLVDGDENFLWAAVDPDQLGFGSLQGMGTICTEGRIFLASSGLEAL